MKINRICTVVTLLALLLLAATLVYGLNLWNIRGVQTSEVYNRYKDVPGVNAAYIKDYRVNDSVTVCVTLLEALDSTSWGSIKKEFKIVAFLDSVYVYSNIDLNETTKILRLAPKNDYNLPSDSIIANNDLIVTNFFYHTICIFHLENEKQYFAICKKQFNDINPKF